MAKTLEIKKRKHAVHLIVDGNEIQGVCGYELSESVDSVPILTVKIMIEDEISVTVDP